MRVHWGRLPWSCEAWTNLYSANLHKDWIGKNLETLVTEKTAARMVLNDADAAGLAEMRFGDEA